MSLYKRGHTWWCHFFIAGKRYRCSTKQTTESKARQYESALIARIQERGPSAVPNKAPTLREYSSRFLHWVDKTHQLKPNTQKYYRFGWERLKGTSLAGMRLDTVTTDVVSIIPFLGPQHGAIRPVERFG